MMSTQLRNPGSSSGLSLAVRLQDGSADAWKELVDLYGPLIESWCRRAGLAESARADVCQDILLSVYRAISRFDPNQPGATFRGWLWTITRNAVLQARRRPQPSGRGGSTAATRLQQIPDPLDCDLADEPPSSANDTASLLTRALDQIRPGVEPQTWNAFWETAVHCRPAPDVAAELGISAASVRQAKSRMLRRLRKQLGDA